MSNAHVVYTGSQCDNCYEYFDMSNLFEDGPSNNYENFTNFNIYGEPLEYLRLTSNGIMVFNNYYSSSNSGDNLMNLSQKILQWGGNSSAYYTEVLAKTWQIPDGPNVLSFQISYTLNQTSSSDEYSADVQIHLIEYMDIIEVNYFNYTGTEGSSSYCGITSGDGTHYTYLNDLGDFPTSDASFILIPGYENDLQMVGIQFSDENVSCDLAPLNLSAGILNKGTVSQSNFDVNLYINDTLFATETVTETLEQLDYIEVMFPSQIMTSQDGEIIQVRAEIDLVDDYENNIASDIIIDFKTAETEPASACYGSTTSLVAIGNDRYSWVAANDPENILYSGTEPFEITENLYEPTEYLVNVITSDIFLFHVDNNFTYVDHDNASGDDRGGIAITQEYLYVVGDENTVRMNSETLVEQTSLPIRDGLFSDLETGTLYTLYNTDLSEDLSDDYSSFPFTVNAIAEMDENLEITTNIIALDQPFDVGDDTDEGGIFAGSGIVLVKDGDDNDLYKITLETGTVDSLGVYDNLNDDDNTENWAMWGFVEQINGEVISLILPSYDMAYGLKRMDITTGLVELFIDFEEESNGYYPNDLHSITYSPWTNRIYFHSETNDEDAGYFNATASLGGNCWTSVMVDIVQEAWAGYDAEVNVCNDQTVDLLTLIPGNANAGGDWTDVNTTGAVTAGMLDATQLYQGTYEFVYTVDPMSPCTDNAQTSLIINVNEAANAGVGTNTSICNTLTYYNLNESLDGTQDIYGYWSDDDVTGVLNGSIIEPEMLAVSDYTFSYHAFGFGACEEDTENITITIDDCSGIEDNVAEFKIYPNPSDGLIYINLENQIGNELSITVTDIQGRIVYKNIILNNELDLRELSEGMYYVEIMNNDKTSLSLIHI